MARGNHITPKSLIYNWGFPFKLIVNGEWKTCNNRAEAIFLYNNKNCNIIDLYSQDVDKKCQKKLENFIENIRDVTSSSKEVDNEFKIKLVEYVADLNYRVKGSIDAEWAMRIGSLDCTPIERYLTHQNIFREWFLMDGQPAYELDMIELPFDFFALSDHPVYLSSGVFLFAPNPRTCFVAYSHRTPMKIMNKLRHKFNDNYRHLLPNLIYDANIFLVASMDTSQEVLDALSYFVQNGWKDN